ncbi:hypothetical protein Scep_022033 [Stephania cephalantha]|uniref:Uncharacterized protein n=1 Tax=Stephania cephalantha TaxID=152367 RepID=A0AAP0FFZ9_9MAGN
MAANRGQRDAETWSSGSAQAGASSAAAQAQAAGSDLAALAPASDRRRYRRTAGGGAGEAEAATAVNVNGGVVRYRPVGCAKSTNVDDAIEATKKVDVERVTVYINL